ncbi:hypothetical protein ADK57_04445 [Streptomyces sp. MMG1533]|uniref:serine/threonine-protein kinase n=1 Tax=Streptomyces sp. MMG1533 TaxID=1415546 RepID=UPI0006C3C69B|nr:serine/threonine-protein kinase [Streptomyces sp. MMG1533]KOU76768.1 hypothetical protein ADK57_04445 [Streptomyces sp. MMG1533]
MVRLGGVSEVAELLGVSRQRLGILRNGGSFPDPVADLAVGPIWDLDEIAAWMSSGLRRTSAGRPSAAESQRLLGDRFGLEDRIGTGGFADVFRALDRKTGDLVAVKVLRDVDNIDTEEVHRFKRELRFQTGLAHQNVIPVLAQGDCSGRDEIWYAMPLATGSLLDVIAEFKDNPAAIADVMRQLCAGLTYVHKTGILHRDLKPANILRTAGGGWAISDFGLARESELMSQALTSTLRQGLGTGVYAAPEQLMRPKDADARADVFSLGKILQHLLTGELPISDDSLKNGPLRPVILRATARHDKRYETPAKFMDAIERALEADKITWRSPEDVANTFMARMQTPGVDAIAVEEFVSWAQRVDPKDDVAQGEVQRVLTGMTAETIVFAWQNNSPGFLVVYENFCSYVNHRDFPFAYCDVLADFCRRTVQTTNDNEILRLTVRTLPELGRSHNRWHVQDVLANILQPIRDAETALVALEALQAAEIDNVTWAINDFVQRSLHPLLNEGIKTIKARGLNLLAS